MSNYYEYRDVKVMIAHALMKMDGWKVYGYYADNSDPMTDYYDPASWGGVAEKNGYILVVNRSRERGSEEIRKYNYDGTMQDISITEKIKKLQAITVERGASEQEQESAQKSIAKLMEKQNTSAEKYIVTGVIPGHMANPPRMNWHIEKDGVYVAKGNGILKYSSIDSYYKYPSYMEDMENFLNNKKEWAEEWVRDVAWRGYYTEEKAKEAVKSVINEMQEKADLLEKFKAFIHKIDTTCGGQIGEGDGTFYEKVTVTKYKKEMKAVEDSAQDGEIKEGQCFVLKSNFNYGCYKGLVYRIHEMEYNNGQKYYTAYKLNGKLTKECHGMASSNNNWRCFNDKFTKWIEQGTISWCHLEEVKTPYEVEKIVKKTTKKIKENKTERTTKKTVNTADYTENLKEAAKTIEKPNYTYEVTEDTDTRDGSQIWLVKVIEKLSRDEYITVNKYMKSIGGYYSKFKHAFLFKENPTELLNDNKDNENDVSVENPCNDEIQEAGQQTKQQEEVKEEDIKEKEKQKPICTFVITPDVHTKTKKEIWVVKPDGKLSNDDFSKVKQKLAVLKGFYSSFKGGFIFNYDPTKKLESEKLIL